MQNFSNSPAPPSLPPGFSGRGGAPYPSQSAEPQISPRMMDDYAGIPQQSLHRGHPHPSQASQILAYSARNRGTVDPLPTQGNMHSGNSSNLYRKEAMDYYFSMGVKDRHRRGGMAFGGGFSYPNIDGPIPHQYRHPGVGSTSSGLMSPYAVDYSSSTGSGGGSGAFSPSHQYNMSQNSAMQPVPSPQMQHRQLGQAFPAGHHGQQLRSYPHSGHRMTPQFSHYAPQGAASSGSSGMYSPSSQRYLDGTASTGFDPKLNNTSSVNSGSNSISSSANNVGPMENVPQSYHGTNYHSYSSHSQSLHNPATIQHRTQQPNLGLGFDSSLKMQHQGSSSGSAYAKHPQASNAIVPQTPSQEIPKSPMHPNVQQSQITQNFSPISNPSPAASAVHSPSCSSSPSPLMVVPEAHGNSSAHGPLHPPTSNLRSSHGRLLQTMSQLSPTPNSNSSISSCGSSGSHKGHSMSAAGSINPHPTGRLKIGQSTGMGSREESSAVYSSSLDKMQDAGLNSLNALSSQVANLPNTVHHMLLADTVFSQKKKDGGQMQQTTNGVPPSQPRSRNASAASSTSTVKDGGSSGTGEAVSLEAGADEDSLMLYGGSSGNKTEREEQFSEGEYGRKRQMSGTSSGSEQASYNSLPMSHNQPHTGQASNANAMTFDPQSKEPVVIEAKANNVNIPSSSFACQSTENDPTFHSKPIVSSSTSSSVPPIQPNFVPDRGLTYNDHGRTDFEKEVMKPDIESMPAKKVKGSKNMQHDEVNRKNGQDKENMLQSAPRMNNIEKEEKHKPEGEQNASGVGVIVSTRSEGNHINKSNNTQDKCVEGKRPHSYLKESSSHNGEDGIDLTIYSSHHQKTNSGRPQSPTVSAPQKYNPAESAYGSDMSVKIKGKTNPDGATESNPKYLGYQQAQTIYGSVHLKDPNSVAEPQEKGSHGATAKGHEENPQMQQFPSLLQEVLQGYNLDRRYGRQEQTYPAHLQVFQQFQSRHLYGATEDLRVHQGVTEGSQNALLGTSVKSQNQKTGCENDYTQDPQSLLKSDIINAKIQQHSEKSEVGVNQRQFPLAETRQPPPKHINLADYSLPQRKALSASAQSSAVQELLLQEPEPLTGSTCKRELQKTSGSFSAPSERRSVICDVSPKRRSTPESNRESEREREQEKMQKGASVIQHQLAVANDLCKKESGHKQVMKIEKALIETGPDTENVQTEPHGSGGVNERDIEFHSKSGHSSTIMNADPYRRGNVDLSPMPSHPMSANPLSSPMRHQSYLHGVDLSAGGSTAFPGYQYSDTREGTMVPRINPNFPSHHPYHNLSPQVQATNNLEMYPHPRGALHQPHDVSGWVKTMNRSSKEMMMHPSSSPGRQKISQTEQRQRMISHTDLPIEQHISKTLLHHQSTYYDTKMWDSVHTGREGARMTDGDAYYRTQPSSAPAHGPVPMQISHGRNAAELETSRGGTEEVQHPCPPQPPLSTSAKAPAEVKASQPQVQRQTKAGSSGETNPLMLRRRVRSFISPIPAKRQLQDASQLRTNMHLSPGAQSESNHHNEGDSASDTRCSRLSSPLTGESTQPISPRSGNTNILPPKKGRGLKLEAIVQKITPSVKKLAGHADVPNHYPHFTQHEISAFKESQDKDLQQFSDVSGGDDSYMDESPSLNDIIPFRGVDDAGPIPPTAYASCDPHETSKVLKQQDFDFGLGTAVASGSGDKEDFTLLGPLPPPPPLPRPVQGSPPPSSSALSDIQHFTNTYQQLETRRGEQSAATLLRQKLQESGMGFDGYPGSDYYGNTSPHHSQGHMLSRQHQMSSSRSSLSPQDSKSLDGSVPKGYFPSGKKKGRPVGSVNKQKRAQNQGQGQAQAQTPPQIQSQNSSPSAPPALPISTTAVATPAVALPVQTTSVTPTTPLVSENNENITLQDPPLLPQVMKVDLESEDTQPEIEVKPVRRRRRGVKDEDEQLGVGVQQRRRRRGAASVVVTTRPPMAKNDPDTANRAGGSLSTCRVSSDQNRRGLFIPHIHVEKKVPEIGAVCTIVNLEEEKTKERSAVGGKAVGSGIDSLLTSVLSSQLSRRDKESDNRESDEVETRGESGKALPSSGHVVSGPVITESNHSGRLLCCLCQKWANYKHLGDLYGPFYPAEYAAKLPKNQPQVRQGQATTGTNKTGPNLDISSNVLSTIQDKQDDQFTMFSPERNYTISLDSNTTSHTTTEVTVSPVRREEMMLPVAEKLSNTTASSSSSRTFKPSLTWDMNVDIRPIPELKREPDFETDHQKARKQLHQPAEEAQQRPQHRKLTSHPRFKRRHKSSEKSPRMVPSNSKASLPFQPPPPALDSLGPLAQLAQLPQMPMDLEELWVHEGCIVWTSGVYLVNGKLYGLQEALDGARETSCSFCEMVGSTLGCYSKGCILRYHYMCAIEADCSLNEDNFSLRCPKHKFTQSLRPAKSVYLEQSERG
ncbi:transcription factor 20 isoform X2 [Gouania willdenowi]|uniref:transcription factor 20 isoform X2 n=1 Tax=Gouania willdenowi TaxID=441366 RepID=UPI001055D388|nr:transcription factor 20 isoform X2 [Gouania willdenowi]